MMIDIEEVPNIGKVLGQRLRAAGIATQADLLKVGDDLAFARLKQLFPEDACGHTRLALAGAVRGVRRTELPAQLRAELTRGLR
jgi:DNA transformation protein